MSGAETKSPVHPGSLYTPAIGARREHSDTGKTDVPVLGPGPAAEPDRTLGRAVAADKAMAAARGTGTDVNLSVGPWQD
ncbi:hypothetical protein [Paeniglutamicibacter sp.]|uniref:hypothetical protein n=1 Tax=Paeniglutamicibacter sp. TaxID=1934391 RepID=UPI003989BA43